MRKLLATGIMVTLLSGCASNTRDTDEVIRVISDLKLCDEVRLSADNSYSVGDEFDTVHCSDDIRFDVYESNTSLVESLEARCDELGMWHVGPEVQIWSNVTVKGTEVAEVQVILAQLNTGIKNPAWLSYCDLDKTLE